jgi:hypothetical protein
MDISTARSAQEKIISLFRDRDLHQKALGQPESRGRIMGAFLGTRVQTNDKYSDLEMSRKVAGAFIGDEKFQIFDGENIVFESTWEDIEGIYWKTTKYEEPVFQKWMLWEFKKREGSDKYLSCIFATYALALSLADTLIADEFYKSFAPTKKNNGTTNLKNFKPENPAGSIILPIYPEINPKDMP